MFLVYKKSGKSLQVNEDMLPYLTSLGLSQEKPQTKKPSKKAKPLSKKVK